MGVSDMLNGGLEGAAGTLATALAAPAKELADAAERDFQDILAFEPQTYAQQGEMPIPWPHPDEPYGPAPDYGPVPDVNGALLDETTIYVARQLITGASPLTPLTLMDLSTYVTTCVLRESVWRNFTSGTLVAGGPGPLRLPQGFPQRKAADPGFTVQSTLLWLQRLRRGQSADAPLATDLFTGWQALLGPDAAPRPDQMFFDDLELNSLDAEQVIEGLRMPMRLRPTDDASRPPAHVQAPIDEMTQDETIARAVAFCNLRGLYNVEYARDLGLAYAGSVTRLPIRRYLWRQGRLGDAVVTAAGPDLAISRTLDDAFRNRVQQALVQHESRIVLPSLLAAVLGSIKRLEQFDDRLLEVREKAAPLRRRIGEIEETLRGADLALSAKTEHQLFAAFARDARLFSADLGGMWPTLISTAGAVTSATTGQSPWITGAMALLAGAGTVSPQKINAVRDRLTRRHLWFVTELGGWCDAVHDATPQLCRLWRPAAGADFDDAFHQQLDRVRRLGYA